MTRIRFSDFQQLQQSNSGLYHALLSITKAEPGGEVVQINADAITGEAFVQAWSRWVSSNSGKVLQPDQSIALELTAKKLESDKARVDQLAAEAAARYFQYWVGQRGLIDTQVIRNAVFEEMEKQTKRNGVTPSAQLLDVVIDYLNVQGALQWKLTEPVSVVPPPPAVPKIAGADEDELPIDENREWVLLAATDVQIRDLVRRQARRNRPEFFHFPEMPATITRKMIVNASPEKIAAWVREFGNDAVDARLQGRA